MKPALAIGLMSGTSADGVDAVLLEIDTDRDGKCRTRGHAYLPFPLAFRTELLALMRPGDNEIERAGRASVTLATVYAQAIEDLLRTQNVPTAQICAIGAHGQTVRHRPELGFTLQLNQPALLAHLTGIDVVADFRSADIAAGGQGAPLAPLFHEHVFGQQSGRRAIVNIGGIANITLLLPKAATRGWDTGPGNCLMDAWCELHTGKPFDEGGAWSVRGIINHDLLTLLKAHPYFSQRAPKSTGREVFHIEWLLSQLRLIPAMAPEDVQATLAELTASTIIEALSSSQCTEIYVCGGGALNAHLMNRISHLIPTAQVRTTEVLGIDVMCVEAAAFAWFAYENYRNRQFQLRTFVGDAPRAAWFPAVAALSKSTHV